MALPPPRAPRRGSEDDQRARLEARGHLAVASPEARLRALPDVRDAELSARQLLLDFGALAARGGSDRSGARGRRTGPGAGAEPSPPGPGAGALGAPPPERPSRDPGGSSRLVRSPGHDEPAAPATDSRPNLALVIAERVEPEVQRATRTAVFSGRALSPGRDSDTARQTLASCLDDQGRLDVGAAAQLLGAAVAEPALPLVLALADTILSLTAAAEDLVRLLNRAVEHLLGVGGLYRPTTATEHAVRAATSHLGPEHPATFGARVNLAIAYQSAGRTTDALAIFERVLADRERLRRPAPAPALRTPGPADPVWLGPETCSVLALRRVNPGPLRSTRAAIFSGRVVPAEPPDRPGRSGRDALATCLDRRGRVDVGVAVQLLAAEVPDPFLPLVLSLADTTISLTEAADDLVRLLNQAMEHLLGVGGAYRPTATAEVALRAAVTHLGAEHPAALGARANLAISYQAADRTTEALVIFEWVLADLERLRGADHPDTLTARANLATSYQAAGRTAEALPIFRRVLADHERLLGPEHPDTLTTRADLAASYQAAGRTAKALAILERLLATRERLLGPEHPDTVATRVSLATSYQASGRMAEALAIFGRVLAERERLLGPEHPKTLTTRANLAISYQAAGRTAKALTLFERVLVDRERLLGPDHPDTLTARGNLAISYKSAGRTTEALALFERVVADRERVLGPEHPKTLTARANLAASYHSAGREAKALVIFERVLADRERLLGADHPKTLTARANLAISYQAAGRTAKAMAIFKRVLADCERVLGPSHADTVAARANLAAAVGRRAAPSRR